MATSSTTSVGSTATYTLTNTLRMSGLATGLDTTSMVNSLMKAERIPLDKLNQKKTTLEWKQAAELDINNLLKDFRDTYLSSTGAGSSMIMASNIKAYKVAMGTASTAVSITANSDAVAGNHTIDSITSIAAGASAASASPVSASMLSTNTTLADLALTTPLSFDGSGALSFSINGKTFTFQSTDTLQTVINKVNSDTTANATLSYSQLTGKFSITSKTTGSASSLVLANGSGNFFGDGVTPSAIGIDAGTYNNGADAVLSIDGVSVTRSTNNFTIDGMTFNLTGTTATPVSYSVSQDIDSAVTKIKAFVDAYNTLIGKLNATINEKVYRDYAPLTDAQRAGMSDTEITQWETKAKSGLLYGDDNITGLLQTMRSAFYDNVVSAGTNAAAIGLQTGSNYSDKGKIIIDETKLRAALASNPDQVSNIFTAASYSTDNATKYSESGLAWRMQNAVSGYLNDYTTNRSVSETDQMNKLNNDITNMTDILTAKENRYWKQFDDLETAMEKMNSQAQWLTQQLSGSSSNG